jgi:hypothetical protein
MWIPIVSRSGVKNATVLPKKWTLTVIRDSLSNYLHNGQGLRPTMDVLYRLSYLGLLPQTFKEQSDGSTKSTIFQWKQIKNRQTKQIVKVAAEKGYGPLMYDLALSKDNLTPSRFHVSESFLSMHASTISNKSVSSNLIYICVSGSPKRALYSRIFGPLCVSMSPGYQSE